ncbi:MAG: hypothetical protein R3A10_02550 [Caldilineaceae bacterium]
MLAAAATALVFVGFYGHLIVRTLAPMIRSPLLFGAIPPPARHALLRPPAVRARLTHGPHGLSA